MLHGFQVVGCGGASQVGVPYRGSIFGDGADKGFVASSFDFDTAAMQVSLKEGSGGIALLNGVTDVSIEIQLLVEHDPEVFSLFHKLKVCSMDVIRRVDDVPGLLSGDT